MLGEARDAVGATRLIVFAVAAITITISWTITQLLFAIHYAHEHYAAAVRSGSKGALEFPGNELPDYWDFFYFSTSIGATSQTSDVAILSRIIRRLVTIHAIVSLFFNATVLALAINHAAGLAG